MSGVPDMMSSGFVCSDSARLDPYFTIEKNGKLIAYWDCKLKFFCKPQAGRCLPLTPPTIPATFYDQRYCLGTLKSFPGAVLSLDKDEDNYAWGNASYVQSGSNFYKTGEPEETGEGSYRAGSCFSYGRGTMRIQINTSGESVRLEDFYLMP